MANTTNFGWETPDDTDLVKDGAAAIRTLGSAIDTSMVDLKGGTTGQVLSKTSNTDMDFTWVTTDDADAIQKAIVDAKGDLIVGTAADTVSRLAVGTNGLFLQAASGETTGLKWASAGIGASTSYTPTATNFTIGNGSFTTAYIETTDLVFYYGKIQFGSTSTYSSSIRISMPVSAGISYVGPGYGYGPAMFRDVSTGDQYTMYAIGTGSTELGFYLFAAGGTYTTNSGALINSIPVNFADGDQIAFQLWYRKA